MHIRKATVKDAERIKHLIIKNVFSEEEYPYTTDQLDAWKKAKTVSSIRKDISNNIIFCAFQNNKLIGTIGLKGDSIFGLYISYHKRRKGIGYKLLCYIESYAIIKGLKKIKLISTLSGYDFYLKNGYKPKGQIKNYYSGIEFIETKMIKELN